MNVYGKEHEAGDVLATAKFHIFGKGWNDSIVDEVVDADLSVSGASPYGNHTCTTFYWQNGNVDSYDTRYSNVSPDNFTQFAQKMLRNNVMDSIAIEVIL